MAAGNERRARLIRAIQAGEAESIGVEQPPQAADDRDERRGGWWDHLLTHFFGGDEDTLFGDLRIGRRVFWTVVSAVIDIPLAHRGRRAFVSSHRERILFLHVCLAFGVDVLAMLLTPRVKTKSEIHRIAKGVCDITWTGCGGSLLFGGTSGGTTRITSGM